MLQSSKFWKLEGILNKKKISIYDLCRETSRFVGFMNSIEFTEDFIEKINFVRKAENSLNTLINILFSELNPELNPIISFENEKNANYNSLILYLQKLKTSIGEARQNLTLSLKNKTDIETNALVNNSNISFFISQLSSIFTDLIYHTMKRATENIIKIEKPSVYFEKEGINVKINLDQIVQMRKVFDYMVYCYFLRTIQSTIPIFSNLRPSEHQIKILPPEVIEYQKMITASKQNPPKQEGGEDAEDIRESQE